jgi:hypothetical protein
MIWSFGPSGGGLEGICELLAERALLRGVAEAELRVVRRGAGEDMVNSSE